MKTLARFAITLSILACIAGILSSCSETAGTGEPVPIPDVTVNCTSPTCRQNRNMFVRVLITTFDCSYLSENLSAASASAIMSCTISGGCYGTLSNFVDIRGQIISTMPSGTYTVCGRVDGNNNYPGITTDDAETFLSGVSIHANSSNLYLDTDWAP